ncbi:nuclear pore complex protein Nup160-like isoform X1 [Anarrhichthys ocellatus]|uniref:nuclear pore complex protein Nup160-like isoform X1 n=1 Tax=Anarrhichthys ocellatus TaxID=433405 RepID=UPI0012EE6264|nr:nuclear pore complex protein Nup160-like isoform X1 [Anarrhichthys ocellatus]
MQSIFTDVGKLSLNDPSHSALIPGSLGQTSTAWISQSGEAHYALASPAGGIMVVSLPPQDTQGSMSVVELKRSSMMQRLSGWMPSSIRGDQTADLVLSLAVRELEEDSFIFALCQDHKLRMWSFREQACLLEADMLDYMPACRGLKHQSGQGHRLRVSSSSSGLVLCVYLSVPQRGQFTVLQLVATDNNRYSLDHLSSLFSTQETLVDFALTSTDIWAVWLDDSNTTVVKYINFEHNTAGQWNQVFVQPPPEEEVHIGVDQDPRETYLEVLFSPLHFTASAIVKALQIYRRGSERITDLSWDSLKKEVTVAVESELQSSVTEFEFSQEEYRQLQVEFWSKFYACCLQYQEVQSLPLGLTVNHNTGLVCLLKKGFVSFLLPCFAVDHLYLSYDEYLFSEDETPITEDPDLGRDVLQLVQCLRLVSDAVSGEMAYEMEKALEHLESPERAADLVLENLLSNDDENVIEEIQNKLQDIRNPMAAMMVLLRELDLETDSDAGGEGPVIPGGTLKTSGSDIQTLMTPGSDIQTLMTPGSDIQTLMTPGSDIQTHVDSWFRYTDPCGLLVQIYRPMWTPGSDIQTHVDSGSDIQTHVDSGSDIQTHVDSGSDLQIPVDSGSDLQTHVDSWFRSTDSCGLWFRSTDSCGLLVQIYRPMWTPGSDPQTHVDSWFRSSDSCGLWFRSTDPCGLLVQIYRLMWTLVQIYRPMWTPGSDLQTHVDSWFRSTDPCGLLVQIYRLLWTPGSDLQTPVDSGSDLQTHVDSWFLMCLLCVC